MEQRRTIVSAVELTAESERQVCRWLSFHRKSIRYIPTEELRCQHVAKRGVVIRYNGDPKLI